MAENTEPRGVITAEEISTAHLCMEYGMRYGASAMRVSLSKSVMDSFTVLNGELDKVMHSADRSVFLYIFADGRYGTFSTNDLAHQKLEQFIAKSVDTVRMLEPDPCRKLAPEERTEKGAMTGEELHLYDHSYQDITPEDRLQAAMSASIYSRVVSGQEDLSGSTLISEECEYSDSIDDNYVADTAGFRGRHTETSFAVCSEITVQDSQGNRLSGYWWESSPYREGLDTSTCSRTALRKAVEKTGPGRRRSGRYAMVVDRSVSSRLVSPLISALGGSSIQQKNSFLEGTLGKKIFSGKFTLLDLAREDGRPGSRLFDTEGVATSDTPVIKDGVVERYFVNTYIAGKTGMEPTVESITRPSIVPFIGSQDFFSGEKEITLQDILKECRNGIYVTGFNGGNCNQTTGDFSYGIEGFAFRNGKITRPIREMVVTGNMISLWNCITAAGSDARECTRWQIPTIAFREADFSA